MSNERPVVWEGKKYRSIQEAADALGISRDTLRMRINRGFRSLKDMPRAGRPKWVWEGEEYTTLAEAAAATGLSRTTIRYYARQGYVSRADREAKKRQRRRERLERRRQKTSPSE